MGIASFAALGFLLTLPVVVLLYLLKLRRREVVVPSTLLWQRSLHDLVANAPFQRLRNNLLLWLQLLALLLLCLALARPYFSQISAGGRHLIFLLDTSASMQARDVEGGRFAAAVDHVRTMIRNKSASDAVMIVVFGGQTNVLQAFTTDARLAERSLDAIATTDGRTEIAEALRIAGEVARKKADTRIFIVSDGVLGERALPNSGPLPVEYIKIGREGQNVGITSLEFRPSLENALESQVFVGIDNYSSTVAENRVVSYYINGELADARTITLEPGARGALVFTNRGVVSGIAQFELDGKDDLPVDDVAYGVLSPQRRRHALLVTRGNAFLERVLGLHPNLDVHRVTPEAYPTESSYDVVVFDNVQPPTPFDAAALVIGTTPPVDGLHAAGSVELPSVLDWDRTHPIVRFVDFNGLLIGSARPLRVPAWARVVMEAPQGPLIVTFERGPLRIVYVGFDLLSSNWPRLLSFPVFMRNAVEWLLERGGNQAFQYAAGGTVPIVTDLPNQEVRVRTPEGTERLVRTNENRVGYFAETTRAGIYEARAGAQTWQFAVNLVSSEESNLVPVETLELGEQRVQKTVTPGISRNEIWYYLLVAGIGVLVLEWWVYTRRSWL